MGLALIAGSDCPFYMLQSNGYIENIPTEVFTTQDVFLSSFQG